MKEGAKRFSLCRASEISFPSNRTASRHLASTTLQRRVRMRVMHYLLAAIDPTRCKYSAARAMVADFEIPWKIRNWRTLTNEDFLSRIHGNQEM